MRNLNKLTMIGLAICGVLFCNASANAKIWNLLDYQGQQFLSKRKNNVDDSFAAGQEETKFNCANYGLIPLRSIGADYECTDTLSAPEGCCGTWHCKKSKYPYSDLSCRSLGKIPDETTECTGNDGTKAYRKCKCDTSTYPNSSSCIAEISGSSCTDDDGTHYMSPCYTDWCDYLVEDDNTGFRCKKYFDDCDTKCEEYYDDTCDYPENSIYPYESECKTGQCDSQGHISGCDERCYSCKSCDRRDCVAEGYMSECPANNVCNDTCIPNSCESGVYVKPTGCTVNYINKYEYCGFDLSAKNCSSLGYNSTSCDTDRGQIVVKCPFDPNHVACL